MSVKIRLPSALRGYAGDRTVVEVEAQTVGEAISELLSAHTDLEKHLTDDQGKLRSFVGVFLGKEDIRHLQGEDTPMQEGDELLIVPTIAGGSGAAAKKLNKEELARYQRHLSLPEVGDAGQRELKGASVLVIGAGGLGAPVSMYLAAAGVGRIGIVDFDNVEISNLQRQLLYSTADVGSPKLDAAKKLLKGLNPHVSVVPHAEKLTSANALDIIEQYDIVADGTDNFATRYLVNDACVLTGKTNVYASIYRFEGQVSVFGAKGGPCYRCLYPSPPPPGLVPSCAEGGVLGVLPGTVGTLQATEVIKILLGIGNPLIGRLLLYDALDMQWRELNVRRDADCPVCGEKPTLTKLIDYEQFCGLKAPEEQAIAEMSVADLKAKRDSGADFVLLDVREPFEYDIAKIEGSKLIPLGKLEDRLHELDKNAEIVVHCKMGGRSRKAAGLLLNNGFKTVTNVAGGINAWAEEIDPTVSTY